jgi:hypothetical protein
MELNPGDTAAQPVQPAADEMLRWLSKELVITLVQSAVLALILQFVLVSFGTATHLIGTWAVAAVAVLAIRMHRIAMPASAKKRAAARARRNAVDARNEKVAAALIAPRNPHRAGDQWFDPLPPTLERRFARLYRHVDRLSYAVVAPRHYESGVRPVLAELARDRIRRHHGVDLIDEPEQARAVLGEDLWEALTAAMPEAPTTADLDRWLTQLERLDPARAPEPLEPA